MNFLCETFFFFFFFRKVCLYTFSVQVDSLPSSFLEKIPEYTYAMNDYSLSSQASGGCFKTVQCSVTVWKELKVIRQQMSGMQALKSSAALSHFTVASLSFKLCWKGLYQTHPLRAHKSYMLTAQALLLTYHQSDLLKFSKKDLKETHWGITEMSSSQMMPSVEFHYFQTKESIFFVCLFV